MSEEQQIDEQRRERYGSRLAQMFGYVTPEDRSRWEQNRAQERKKVSSAKIGAKNTASSMMEFGDRNIRAKLEAAHRVAAQEQFEESHDLIRTTRRGPKQSIIESVEWEPRDDRTEIEPDLEM